MNHYNFEHFSKKFNNNNCHIVFTGLHIPFQTRAQSGNSKLIFKKPCQLKEKKKKSHLTFWFVLSFDGAKLAEFEDLNAFHLLKRIFQSAAFLIKDQAPMFNRSLGSFFGLF